ncbi:solute carrier family 35 member G1-like [Tropilaelaps mercedesae]|uniref:Solute carrier family 35 member G1-like n=1 Tax=Tropilaelaps mercedesae TaxID=418985 RepID=A0A1V9X7P6_9ACAR|nr:solute carrier family 35 member G1-like [Tropilaelaps mercedesae]
MDSSTPPAVTKGRLLDTIIDMADFLDGICRLRLRPTNATAQPLTAVHLVPLQPPAPPEQRHLEPLPPPDELDSASQVSDLDDESSALNIPEEEPIELASLSSSPAAKPNDSNPLQFATPVLQQPLTRRAPLAQAEPEFCEREMQTDSYIMANRSVQTSEVNLSVNPGMNEPTKNKSDAEAEAIAGQPSLTQLWKGLVFASLSALFFSACSAIVKNLKYMGSIQLGAVRFTGILLLSFPAAVTRPEPLFGVRDTRLMLLARAIAGSTSLVLRFFAFQHMPLGEASTIIFSVPIFVTVLARIFLNEVCSVFHIVTCFLTVLGIGLITKLPLLVGGDSSDTFDVMGDNNERLYGVIAALSSCIFAASVIILLRKLKETDPYVIMFNFGWIALLLTSTATFVVQRTFIMPKTMVDAGLLVILAVLSFFGQLTLTFSLRTEEAGPVSVMRATVDIMLVFIWQVAFFREIPDLITIAGVVMVITCVIFTGFRKWALSLPETSNTRRKLGCCL